MEIGYKFSPKEIKKLSKFKDPSVILEKENIVKNGKDKIHLTKNVFNKLLSENKLKYIFTNKRKEYYIQNGGSLASIFKAVLPYAKDFAKKLIPSLGIATASTLVQHGINKSLNKNKRKGGNIKINLSQSDIKKMNNILQKLFNMKLTNYKSISGQNGSGIFTSILLPLIASAITSLISGKGCCKKDIFLKNK